MAALFNEKLSFVTEIDGTMNGNEFKVTGNGVGSAKDGYLNGTFKCTTGNLPFSFAALASTFGYGYKCFAQYPADITNFFHLCFPDGYSQKRIIKFQSGGVITTDHTITMKGNTIHNKVRFTGIDFAADCNVITKNIKGMLPTTEYSYPYEEGMRSLVYQVFPLINGGGFEVAEQTTINKPLGKSPIMKPGYHHLNVEIKQTNIQENSVVQDEGAKAYTLKVL